MAPVSPTRARGFRFRRARRAPRGSVGALLHLMDLMAGQHGVASTRQARALGVTRRVERRLLADGVLVVAGPGVLRLAGDPVDVPRPGHGRGARRPVCVAVSHGAAARLHGLDGFEGHDVVDVIAGRGADPRAGPRRRRPPHPGRHRRARRRRSGRSPCSRSAPRWPCSPRSPVSGPRPGPSTAPSAAAPTLPSSARAAEAWRRRGRAGPGALLTLLDRRAARRPDAPVGRAPAARCGIAQ